MIKSVNSGSSSGVPASVMLTLRKELEAFKDCNIYNSSRIIDSIISNVTPASCQINYRDYFSKPFAWCS